MTDAISSYISFSWLYWGLSIAYAVTIFSIICVILSENRNPVKSLAWVTVLLLVPAVGLVLYIIFGRNITNKRIISRRNRRRLKRLESAKHIDFNRIAYSENARQQIRLAHSLTGAMYYPDNDASLYDNGTDKFEALLADIASAQKYINLQYYIFEDDNIGHRLRDALIERARAGVTVRVIYDHVGSFKVRRKFFKEMTREGIQVYPFFKVTFPQLGTRINWRNHRKICVIDGIIGYVGGMNIADRYITGGSFPFWRDLHMRVTGPAVSALQFSFAVDWNFMGQPLIEDDAPITSNEKKNNGGGIGMQLLTSGPTSQWSNISLAFHKAIANARKRIFIQTPYFLPTEGLLRVLQTAALAKVDVRIMMPRHSDSAMLRWASFSYVQECLRSGIKIYLYEKGMLHSKAIVIDDEMATIGSTNFDFRSFEHNFESNMFVFSREFNAGLAEIFIRDMKDSCRISTTAWRRRPLFEKIFESVMRLFAPIL